MTYFQVHILKALNLAASFLIAKPLIWWLHKVYGVDIYGVFYTK